MSARQREALMGWLAYAEAHPAFWEHRVVLIPLASIDMTFDEVDALFGLPTLAEVRQAVEDWCADDEAGNHPWGAVPVAAELGTEGLRECRACGKQTEGQCVQCAQAVCLDCASKGDRGEPDGHLCPALSG